MKTIGLLGGMSWESTALYYRLINEETRRIRGQLHSAPIAMFSVDFQEVERLQHREDWNAAGRMLSEQALKVQAAGADFLVLCTNTMHKVADPLIAAIDIPLLHIADATAFRVKKAGFESVGLLGTKFTMEDDFYKGRLKQHGLNVLVPEADERDIVHRVIYDELCLGQVCVDSREMFLDIIDNLKARGAEGVIEGCTEIVMLVNEKDTEVPLFDTTSIHACEAVSMALA